MSQTTRPDQPYNGAFRRLRYERGQMLCAAQFQAEQSYFRQRDDLTTLALHGSGTVSGLKLGLQGTTLTVSPGLAIDGTGRLLRVASLVTLDLRGTTGGTSGAQGQVTADPSGAPVTRYVVLEPTETEEGGYIRESSAVCLRGAPPAGQSAGLARSFAQLMSRVVPGPCGTVTVATICNLVRNLTPDGSTGDCHPLEVVPQQLQAVWQAALRTYVTEVAGRPEVDPTQHTPSSGVLLGTVRFRPGTGTGVELSEEGRPVLAPTLLLQECLAAPSPTAAPAPPPWPWPWPPWPYGTAAAPPPGPAPQGASQATLSAAPAPTAAAYRLVGAGQVTVDGGQVTRVDATGFGLADVVPEGNQIYRIGFAGYSPQGVYIVKGTPVTADTAPPSTFALLAPAAGGLRVKVTNAQNGAGITGFQVEIVQVLS